MKSLEEIKKMMVAGETARADEELKKLLASEPDNLQAKMLYGTCRQLLGDEETFKRIHDEIAPEMDALQSNLPNPDDVSDDSPTADTAGSHEGCLSLDLKMWQQYHQTYLGLNSIALTLDDADSEDGGETYEMLYGVASVASFEEIFKLKRELERKRRCKRIGCLLLLVVPFLFWIAWWLGQKL